MVLTLEDCRKVIYKHTNGKGKVKAFKISSLGDEPMGFLGEHYKLKITYEDIATKEMKFARFFLKTVPNSNPNHMQYVNEMGVFKKEALLYKNLISNFVKFHNKPIAPKCYLVQADKFIVLEDLSSKGFTIPDMDLSLAHWEAVIQTMARFHASCIIFEEQRYATQSYRVNEFYRDELKESTFSPLENHPRYKWALNTSKAIADSMKLVNCENRENEEKIKQFVSKKMLNYTKASKKYRNVITHADLWRNNIMFRQTQEELDCIFIDFQLARYVPAAFDILTTLHVNASSHFLDTHMEGLLRLYYNVFRESLELKKIEVDRVMTYDQFLESIKEYQLPALVEATMFATICFVGPELSNLILDDEDVFNEFNYTNRSKFIQQEFKENINFREKYSDIMMRLISVLDQSQIE